MQYTNKHADRVLTIAQAMKLSGLKYWRIYAAIRSGELPSFRNGNEYYIEKAAFDIWRKPILESGDCVSSMITIGNAAEELYTTPATIRWLVKRYDLLVTKHLGLVYVNKDVIFGLFSETRGGDDLISMNELCRQYKCSFYTAKKVLANVKAKKIANRLYYVKNEVKEAFDAYQR